MKLSPVYLIRSFVILFLAAFAFTANEAALGQLVPGTGKMVEGVGDDFEDEEWEFLYRYPKSSQENDGNTRSPLGRSTNGRWDESPLRGEPDHLVRVPTPDGGLPGSKGALKMQTLYTGVPRVPTREMQQDDLLANSRAAGGSVPISREPSVVVRVYVPEFDQWEERTGTSFGFRLGLRTTKVKESGGFLLFRSSSPQPEPYWPGIFIFFRSKADGATEDSARLLIRGNQRGYEIPGPDITPGWWTLGMSVTSDGAVHYYARKGVEDLAPEDHITSQFPYGYRAERFRTFFFNIANGNDARTWSTAWIIDDPALYFAR